ncbi:MAG: hypothetical protein KIS66_10055 [Fimbriimonadaceae bacterium]|nr:hypothetical protein [Fimbriimonadaceae bacterium]
MRNSRTLLVLIAVLGLSTFGCQPSAPKDAANAPTEAPASAGETKPNEATSEAPKPDLAALPADLKHAGYDYYGLGNPKQVELEIVSGTNVHTGTQTTTLEKIENGKASFHVDRTGGIAMLGSGDYSLEKDGVYAVGSSLGTVSRSIELPADLAPGKTWTVDFKLEASGSDLKYKATMKAVAIEKVKTKSGTYDAIRIESSGPGTHNGKPIKMAMKGWYAKGEGAVKMEMSITDEKGQTNSTTIERVK